MPTIFSIDAPSGGTPTALVVEPSVGDAVWIALVLSELGFRVMVSETFQDASIRLTTRPALLVTELRHDHNALLGHAVRANVRLSVNHLRHGSGILEQYVQQRKLLVVGAEYSLETGKVEFFDGTEWGA